MEHMTRNSTLRLPSIISNNMVLQQGRKAPIWGTAQPKDNVTVTFRNKTVSAKARKDGRWRVEVSPGKPGGPFQMIISTTAETVIIKNILVGDVWLASGQSNMEWPLRDSLNGKKEAAKADYPKIRLFLTPQATSTTPLDNTTGRWLECNPTSAAYFSGVGYFFSRDLLKERKYPIGMIGTYWGGTSAEAWTSLKTLKKLKGYERELKDLHTNYQEESYEDYLKRYNEWEQATKRSDPGNEGYAKGYANPDFDDTQWDSMDLPCAWERAEKGMETLDGAVWFRKQIEVPASWTGKDLTLSLGVIDDFDTTYFNGTRIGGIGKETENAYLAVRTYTVPAAMVKQGRNTIAVRVFDNYGNGGIMPSADTMQVVPNDNSIREHIDLTGAWKYQVELVLKPEHLEIPKPAYQSTAIKATALFNAMIHPFINFALKGFLWYQGESNESRPFEYRRIFTAMIKDWRRAWKNNNLPFLFVQLPIFRPAQKTPNDPEMWGTLRESQVCALKLPHTAMAVILDGGDALDVHPTNKLLVGKRLALAAIGSVYKKKITHSGPMYKSMAIKGNRAVITFKHTGRGLISKGGSLRGFAIAGRDRNFVWADARIVKNKVVVSSDTIQKPAAVRYAWADNPVYNLYNKEGLPASPFRTDTW